MHNYILPLLLVNECKTNNGGCEDECVDTLKSYTCLCSTGYALSNDGYSCEGKLKHIKIVILCAAKFGNDISSYFFF